MNISKIIITLLCFLQFAAQNVYAASASSDKNLPFVKYENGYINSDLLLAKINKNSTVEKVNKFLNENDININHKYTLVSGLVSINTNINFDKVNESAKILNSLSLLKTKLLASKHFDYVEYDYVDLPFGTVNDSAYQDGTLWALKNLGQNNGLLNADIDADKAWDTITGSPETIVAVIDTGVRITHNDLIDRIWVNSDEIPNNGKDDDGDGFIDNYNGIDSFNDDGSPEDLHGHGTHCSGTIAASANDGNPHVGVAYNATILPCKAGDFGFPHSALIKAIDFCVRENIKIANCSYGGYFPSQASFDTYAAAGENDLLFIAAAGNDANNNDNLPAYPASYDLENIIAVAATDREDNITSFSNYGETAVDLGAPGADIYSTTSVNDQSYEVWDGTSMAAPHVAGVAALIRSVRSDWTYLQVREKILESVDVISSLDEKTVTGGRLNAAKAVENLGAFGVADGDMELSINPPSGSLLMAGDKLSILLTVIDGEKVENAVATMLQEDGTTSFFSNDGIDPDLIEGDNIYTSYYKVPEKPQKLKLTLFVSAEGKNDAIRVINYDVASIPENDSFNYATKISQSEEIIESYNTFATVEADEPRHSGLSMQFGSLWWKWTSNEDGKVFLDTSGSDIDANIAVYTGNNINDLILVARNQNYTIENRDSGIYFNAKKGKTYRFCISSSTDQDVGYIRMRVAMDGRPDINKPVLYGLNPINGFISTTNRVEISGYAADPKPNASGVREVLVKLNNGLYNIAVGKEKWFIPLSLSVGENMLEIVAVDFSGNYSDAIFLQFDYFPPDLTNDHFVNARSLHVENLDLTKGQNVVILSRSINNKDDILLKINGIKLNNSNFDIDPDNKSHIILKNPITLDSKAEIFNSFWITETVSTKDATKEFGEPDHAGNEGGSSVWFKFEAPYDGYLTLDILESEFDTLLGMYIGNSINNLKEIKSSDDAFLEDDLDFDPGISQLNQAIEKGTVVYIAADGYGGDGGNLAIRSQFVESNIHKLRITTKGDGEILSPIAPFSDIYGEYSLFKSGEIVDLHAQPRIGSEFIGWSGNINVSENKLKLSISDSYNLTANFLKEKGNYNFDTGTIDDFRWSFNTDNPWSVDNSDSFNGGYSLKSGNIGNMMSSELSFTGSFYQGEVSFAVKTSTEEDWDKLEFIINGKKVKTWSGEIDWKEEKFKIGTGLNTLKWIYSKDFANSAGEDRVRIDNIKLPLSISATSRITYVNEQMNIYLKGEPHHNYCIFSSSDLENWTLYKEVKLDNAGEAVINIIKLESNKFYKALIK